MIRDILLILLFSSLLNAGPIDDFLKKYPHTYQDVWVKNNIIASGEDHCLPRLEMIKPALQAYKRPFSVLDVGAAQGYFSFNIAMLYPHAECTMIDANTDFYNHGDMLYDLCLLNNHLPNITYLKKKMTTADFIYLNCHEHFDVILAFLVTHQIEERLDCQILLFEQLMKLGDNVIIEIADDVATNFSSYVEYLSKKRDCIFLGEVKRHKDPQNHNQGKLFWFKNKKINNLSTITPLKKKTLLKLNSVYPKAI